MLDFVRSAIGTRAIAALVAGSLSGCGGSQPLIATSGAGSDIQQARSHRLIFKYTGSGQTSKVPILVSTYKVDAREGGRF
jgi:hypothetical protein